MTKVVEEILDGLKSPKRTESLQINVQKETGLTLPVDYLFFLTNYSGYETFIKDNYVVLWDLSELTALNEGYEVQVYLPEVLAIGSNGGGEMIGLERLDDKGFKVILIPFGALKDRDYSIDIGNSFVDFLSRMKDGISWFKS